MKTKSLILFGLLIVVMTVMTACSNDVGDSEEAILNINFGNFESQVIGKDIVYNIDIDGPTPYNFTANKGELIQKKVNSGVYKISVIAWDLIIDEEYAAGVDSNVKVNAGVNKVAIQLNRADGAATPRVVSHPGVLHTDTSFNIQLASDTPGSEDLLYA